MKPHSATQRGYTLVELAITVAILSVLFVAGLKGVQSILLSNQINEQVRKVAKVRTKLAAYFFSNPSGTQGWMVTGYGRGGNFSLFETKEETIFNRVAIGDYPYGTTLVYKVFDVPQAACADLARGVDGLTYAFHIKPVNSAYPVDWRTEKSVVKTPGAASVNITALATLCDANSNAYDFYMALAR